MRATNHGSEVKTKPKVATQTDVLIGNRLRARRPELHLSQSQLAAELGVSYQQVQKYEKGVNRVGAGRLIQIAAILQTAIAYFMGDVGAKKTGVAAISNLSHFLATKDGVAIVEAMLDLNEDNHRAIIKLARTLATAYGGRTNSPDDEARGA